MAEWFLTCLRVSFFASVMILAVLLARPLLRKAPRNITCLLWILVAVRLLVPFELQSPVSLQPLPMSKSGSMIAETQTWSPGQPEWEPITEVWPEQTPVTDVQSNPQNPGIDEPPRKAWDAEPETVFAAIWMTGAVCLLVYAVMSLVVLRYRVRDAIRCPDGIRESDRIADAFLLGYWKPRIYLPANLTERDRELIVAHERAHQSRGDQWWKLLGQLCLSVHWFNPLVWLGFGLMCRDIEAACDEKVIHNLDLEQRKDYSMALLNSGKRMSGLLSYPVSFGEVNLRHRIKSVLSYRKPGLWVTLGAITLAAVIAVCFMTNPEAQEECVHEFDSVITSEATCLEDGVRTDTCKLCKYSSSVPVPATGHSYDDGVVNLEASCTAVGTLTYNCSICNHTLSETIPMVAHIFDEGVATQVSTCSEKGVLTYTCKTCGKIQTGTIDTLEHTFGEKTVTKTPNCVTEGEISVSCAVCGYQELVEKISKSDNHDYENKVIRKPTCMDPGKGQKVCKLCGHSVDFDYDLTDHSYGDGVVTKEATCSASGEQTYTCSVCEYVKTETVFKKDHTWNEVDCNTPATCTVCGAKGEIRGHNYVYTTQSSVGRTLSEKIGTCIECGDTKFLYSGASTYDRKEVKSIGTKYAKKLGFITDPCPGHGTYSKITREPYVSYLERNGGQEKLEDMLLSMIDELDSRCEDNSKYYAEVVVEYPNPYGIGDGAYFRLVVYYHLCLQGDNT